MAKTSAGPCSDSSRLSLADLRARSTTSPDSLAVSDSCFSRSVRSVTTTTLNLRSTGSERIARTRKTIVRLLPEPLGVPDDSAAQVVLAVLRPSLAGSHPHERFLDRAVLLIPGNDLETPAVRFRKQREMPDDVDQAGLRQHPGGRVAPARSAGLPTCPDAEPVRPCSLVPDPSIRGSAQECRECRDARLVAVGRHDKLIRPEQALVPFGQSEIPLVGIAAQLFDALGHWVDDVGSSCTRSRRAECR